jgi:hypothetical protein
MAGMIVRSNQINPRKAPLELYRVHDELAKKKIPKAVFARALGITSAHLEGKGIFPAHKVDECWRLLESWGNHTT